MIDFDSLKKISKDDSLVFTLSKVGSKRPSSDVRPGETYSGTLHLQETSKGGLRISVGRGFNTVTTSEVQSAQMSGNDMIAVETIGGFYELTWRKEK